MKKIKKLSSIMSIVFMLQFILPVFYTNTVHAEGSDPITFSKVENRPVKEAIRYKNKTIILDRYEYYYDDNGQEVVDHPTKLIVEENGNKHIVSEDVQLLRGFIYIGIRDNFAFFVDTYNKGEYVYKVDLNNYTIQKTDEKVFDYTKNVNIDVKDAVFDTAGNKWFSDQTGYWDFRDANGKLIENAGAFILYNSLGKLIAYKISSRVITNYESVGHITPGNDSDVWFTYSYIKDNTLNTRDNKIIRVTKDGSIEEYPIDSNYYIDDIRVDKSGNVYLKGTNWVKEGYKMVKKEGMVMHYTFTNGNLQHLQDYPVESTDFADMDLDANGNLWILYSGKPLKLENGKFNLKYYTFAKMNELSVYDDNNMVTFCFDSGYTNITVKDAGSNIPATDSNTLIAVQNVLNQALSDKTFYSYNLAYTSIMQIQDVNTRDPYLWKLATITNQVLTPTVNNFAIKLKQLCSNPNGKLYNEIMTDVFNSSLSDMDKGYLLGELTGWGKQLVYTPDYIKALDLLTNAWTKKDQASYDAANTAILSISNQASKSYLLDELAPLKQQITTK